MFVKAVTIIYYYKDLYALSQEILALHNNEKGPHQDVMYNWAWRLDKIATVQLVLYFFSAIGFCLYPLYEYVILNEKTLIYDLLLPFDPTTKNGYAITIATQIFLTYGTTVIIFAVDLLFLLMIFGGAAYISLFECDCKMLSIELEKVVNIDQRKKYFKRSDAVHELLIKSVRRSQNIYELAL